MTDNSVVFQESKDIIRIPLTQGYCAIIDSTDYEIANMKWCATLRKRTVLLPLVYATHRTNSGSTLMHRVIMGNPPFRVDHRNGDGLDNRRENLRRASNAENAWNQGKRPGSSMYKGVRFRPSRPARPWYAGITVGNKNIALGTFLSEAEAGRAYNVAAVEFFGEFARLNNILPEDAPFNLTDSDMQEAWRVA